MCTCGCRCSIHDCVWFSVCSWLWIWKWMWICKYQRLCLCVWVWLYTMCMCIFVCAYVNKCVHYKCCKLPRLYWYFPPAGKYWEILMHWHSSIQDKGHTNFIIFILSVFYYSICFSISHLFIMCVHKISMQPISIVWIKLAEEGSFKIAWESV